MHCNQCLIKIGMIKQCWQNEYGRTFQFKKILKNFSLAAALGLNSIGSRHKHWANLPNGSYVGVHYFNVEGTSEVALLSL